MRQVSLLVVLDGFGYSESTEANAIAQATTPTWDRLWADCPHTLISASGTDVGLPNGQMGNSEVGHMTLGAGRVVYQDFSRINRTISQGEFANNRAINAAIKKLKKSKGALHVMGLLSPGGVHSHEEHLFELLRIAAAKGLERVYLHAFLDGRDTPPRSALASIQAAENLCAELGVCQLVSLCGRYYAMDRDQRWDRLERAYNLIVRGEAPFHATSGRNGLEQAYKREESDEFVQPTAVHSDDQPPISLKPEDAVVFMNFRADRARQLTHAMVDEKFDGFERRSFVQVTDFVTLTRYADDIHRPVAFDRQNFTNTLGEYLANLGRRQLRIAETEKYAHVTFFFSGGREEPYAGEDRLLIPSPKVATYDLQPAMSACEVTDELVRAIRSGTYDAIICNYANGDMVGHTGKLGPSIEAVQTLDKCLARVCDALAQTNGQMLITADHGNVEQMRDGQNDQDHTAHTNNLVPLVYVGAQDVQFTATPGALSDVAPTLLDLMHLDIPAEMTGRSLVTIKARQTARA